MIIPKSHPRYQSLRTREELVRGASRGLVVPQGLIAHGRGEAFDYILGEQTTRAARRATEAAAALLLIADKPVMSVNGNTAALVPKEMVKLARSAGARVEVNLFHRSTSREEKIARVLEKNGAEHVYGVGRKASARIPGLKSLRGRVDPSGIGSADVVLVPLEDGDRATMLRRAGRKVIAIDLNPLSRTSRAASVTIVDNATRAIPNMIREVARLKKKPRERLLQLVNEFDNEENLNLSVKDIMSYLNKWSDGKKK